MAELLVVASNRGPVSWREEGGDLVPHRGFGGLVTAVGGALEQEPGTWVSVAMSDDDRRVATEHGSQPFEVDADGSRYTLRLLDLGERFEPYYNQVSNRLLWFTVHGLWHAPYQPEGSGWSAWWHDGYLPVNAQVAEAVVDAAGDGHAEVHLQDYHLCAAAPQVRAALPQVPILQYIHTPWPGPTELRRLPDAIAEGVLRGLLHAHVVAFSAPGWAEAFRRCAQALLGARVDGDHVSFEGRETLVTDFVLGVDTDDLASSAASAESLRAGEDLDNEGAGRRLVLRVDRTDLSKNILRGLHAYELLLERHPEHRGQVWHYAHLNPSRQGVPEYRAYLDACLDVVGRIQERFGDDSVTVFVGDDYPRAVAALQRYDVLLTNPVRDGTNLVAKEGATLNRRHGVVVLSRHAGAATMLADAALVVNPFDVEGQAEALHAALTMSAPERAERAERLQAAARRGAPEDWFAAQRDALRLAAGR